jgi:hypothetical protein
MNAIKHWTVDIVLDEQPGSRTTRAEARLHTGDPSRVLGIGRSWRNPHDPETPEIGDEFAAARALADLAQRLRVVADEQALDLDGESSHGW